MLRCLGCNIPSDKTCPTKIFNDNYSVAQNAQNPAADFSKKHVAISYYAVREAIAAGVIVPYWIHCDHIFWQPDFHLSDHNHLDQASDKPDAN